MKKIFETINLDIQEVADFIEEQGLEFICNDKMQVETSEEDFETLIERFPELDYVEAEEDTLEDIAVKNGLDIVETTSERSGYPRNLKDVLVGFGSFGNAEQIAKEYGLTLIWIDKRDGWQLWHRGDRTYEPMSISSSDFGDDYNFENNADDFMDMARERISDMCDNGASFDEIREYMEKVEKVTDAIDDLEDDQMVVTCCGEYYDTIDLHPIYFSYDTKTTQLAAIKD